MQQVFFTKRVNDPNLVPMLLAHGVRFGAAKAGPLSFQESNPNLISVHDTGPGPLYDVCLFIAEDGA